MAQTEYPGREAIDLAHKELGEEGLALAGFNDHLLTFEHTTTKVKFSLTYRQVAALIKHLPIFLNRK